MSYDTSAADPDRIRYREIMAEEWVASAALVVIVLSITWGVVTRYLLKTPAVWTTEAAAIAFAWMVFVGAAAVFRRGEHIAIDALLAALPASLRRVVQALSDLIVLAVLLVLSWLSVSLTISTFDAPTTVLRLPQSVLYGAAAVGFLLMTLRHVQRVASLRKPAAGSVAP